MATISILNGLKAGQSYEFGQSQVQLGRDSFCDLVIPQRSISRQHARILHEPDGYYIEDLNSLNGTFINDQRITRRTRLGDRDRIRLFDVLLQFFDGAAPVANASTMMVPPTPAPPPPATRDGRAATIVGTVDARSIPHTNVGAQAKLRAVLEITRNLGESLAVDEFLHNILDTLFQIFPQADRGYILLRNEADGKLAPRAIKRGQGEGGDSRTVGPINRTIAERIMADGKAILSTDAAAHAAETAYSVLDEPVCSMISAPLMGPSHKPLGLIHIDTTDADRQFNKDDLEVLVSVATVAGQAVEHARVHEAAMLLDRRQRELAMAQQVQLHFLPQQPPDLPGYQFYSFYRAAEDIGGDYFGYIPLADGRLAMALADVSGKGVSAALLMARLCAEVRYCVATSPTPVDAINRLNREFAGPAMGDMFITFLLAVLDPRDHRLTLINAGHMPPLWRHGRIHAVEQVGVVEAGPPLGYDANQSYAACTVTLEPGDVVVMYTDGISEASNPAGTFFGIKGVYNLVSRGAADVETLGRQIISEVERFMKGNRQGDDICLLCFART